MDFRTAHTDVIMRWEDKQLGILRRNYPGWVIWLVREFPCLTHWHALPKAEQESKLVAETPEELVGKIVSCN